MQVMLINLVKQSIITLGILFLLMVKGYTQEVLPSGCIAVVIKSDIVTIPAEKYIFLFLHNLASNDVWLVHQPQGNDLQSNLTSKMSAGMWSALFLNKQPQEMRFNCIESKPGHEQKISCKDVLAICQWPNVKIPANKKGTFFVAESMDLSGLTAYSERNGYSIS